MVKGCRELPGDAGDVLSRGGRNDYFIIFPVQLINLTGVVGHQA